MCEFCNKINQIINSNFSEQEKLEQVADETNKESIIDYLIENNLGVSIEELGLTQADIDDLSNVHQLNDKDVQLIDETFAESKIINLYRYISNSYGPSNIGPDTRRFCEQLVKRTGASMMRFEDIVRLNSSNPGLGKGGSDSYSIFDYRGGVNCKHIWVKYLYQVDTKNLVKAPKQPNQPKGPNGGVPGIKTNK